MFVFLLYTNERSLNCFLIDISISEWKTTARVAWALWSGATTKLSPDNLLAVNHHGALLTINMINENCVIIVVLALRNLG